MTDFANSFGVRYPTLGSVWKALAEGETPDDLPVEWKSISYYAHVFSYDEDATVKMSAQAFLRELEVARLDPQTYAARLMLATQSFAQAICELAGIPWQDNRRKGVSTPQERQATKPKSPAKANARKAKRPR